MGIRANRKESSGQSGIGDAPVAYVAPARPARGLADALFTTTQQRVLGALYGNPRRSFSVSEMITLPGVGSGTVQRELAKLARGGLLTVARIGNQKRYQADPAAPIHDELVAIVQKTVGLAGPLREALQPLAKSILAAFVYGSVAKHSDTATSDIDVLIVSDTLGYADIMRVVGAVEVALGRKVNPTIYSPAELAKRMKSDSSFVRRVFERPRIWLIGGEDDLRT